MKIKNQFNMILYFIGFALCLYGKMDWKVFLFFFLMQVERMAIALETMVEEPWTGEEDE